MGTLKIFRPNYGWIDIATGEPVGPPPPAEFVAPDIDDMNRAAYIAHCSTYQRNEEIHNAPQLCAQVWDDAHPQEAPFLAPINLHGADYNLDFANDSYLYAGTHYNNISALIAAHPTITARFVGGRTAIGPGGENYTTPAGNQTGPWPFNYVNYNGQWRKEGLLLTDGTNADNSDEMLFPGMDARPANVIGTSRTVVFSGSSVTMLTGERTLATMFHGLIFSSAGVNGANLSVHLPPTYHHTENWAAALVRQPFRLAIQATATSVANTQSAQNHVGRSFNGQEVERYGLNWGSPIALLQFGEWQNTLGLHVTGYFIRLHAIASTPVTLTDEQIEAASRIV